MWYFAWILGTGLAATLAILNGLWFEFKHHNQKQEKTNRSIKNAEKK